MPMPPAARRAALFLVALALPSAGVVGLGLRSIAQERELAERRAVEDDRHEVRRVHDALFAALEPVRLDGVGAGPPAAASSDGGATASTSPPRAIFTCAVRDGRLVLPWDAPAASADARASASRPASARAIADGERAEYADKRPDLAAAAYGRAVATAGTAEDAGYARLQLARVSARLSRAGEAVALYRQVLALPSSVADDQQVPLAYYAAERLLELRADASAVSERLMADIDGGRVTRFGPASAYKLRSLLQAVRGGAAAPPGPDLAVDIVSRRIQAVERAMALQRDFQATLASRLLSPAERTPESVWLTYGGERPWFVAVSTTPERQALLVAVDAEAAFAAACTGRSAGATLTGRAVSAGTDDQPLGPRFPDATVRVAARSDAADPTWRTARNFYGAALGLVLGVTAVGGYLLWRDVRREVRLAETRSQFVASVSHELKTPLTSIRMFAETLLMRDAAPPGARGLEPADRAEYLETIVNESERLTRLLNNVLDFSRIDRGEKAYQLKPASLTEVVRAAARSAAYTASLQNVDIVVDVPDGPCEAPVDADAIQQAVLNLLTNAIKYAGDARKVALSLTCSDGRAAIAVRDWGIGIPRRDHARVFERFYRVASEDNRSIPGTGLGLALVAHAVAGHDGRIEIESEPGRGSTFIIQLPTEPHP